MSDFVVTEDQMGGLHLYETNFTRPKPIAEWHGFRSYQDLSDFFTFGLHGPAPVVDEIPKEGRRGEYSPRPDDGVPPPLASLEVVQPVATATDQAEASTASASASVPDHGSEVGAPVLFTNHRPWCDTLVKPFIENWPCNCRS